MKNTFNEGDLVVYDDGRQFLVGIYGLNSVSYHDYEDNGDISYGNLYSLTEQGNESFNNCITLLEANFCPPYIQKYCGECGSMIC